MKKKNLLMTVIAIFGLATITMAQVPSYVPTNGLVGWWPFNGNANDESGNNLHGNVIGATLTTDRLGNSSSAFNFNVTNWSWGAGGDEIYIPFNSIMNVSNITVSAWFRRNTDGTSNQGMTVLNRFQYGYSNPNGQTWGMTLDQNSSLLMKTWILQAAPNNSQTSIENVGPFIELNSWQNVIFTFDGLSLKQYVDGILVDTDVLAGFTLNTNGNSGISIGVSDQANGHWSPFGGQIDDIGIWNRALTQKEITDLYNANTVSINENIQSKLFSVFPNPAQGLINIKADSKLIGDVYSIYDNTGRVVLTGKINSENTTIELGNLSGGIYMFGVGEDMKQTFKVIKE
ncbi:MAG: T9SS type A sorting domain-containing protein [Bacteroidetes bacterium]|nr:T9SS type A sorting domain-containing protein [Bacteroidota bacterium]